jgi:hypothetical protein
VQQIKNATGMSAQQLNSNFELQNALNALSDPQVGFEAATKIIDNLRKTYGIGGEMTPAPASRGAAGEQPAAPSAPAAFQRGAEQVIQSGPNKGKTAVFDGVGWKLKE